MMNIGKWTSTTFSFILGGVLCVAYGSARADELNAKLLPLSSGDMALILEHAGVLLSGQGKPNQDYLYVELMNQSSDSKSAGSPGTREGSAGTGQPFLARWGHAELILSCTTQQVILFQEIEGTDQEVLAASFDSGNASC